MSHHLVTLMYIGAGLVLPLFYLLQVRTCLRDASGLDGFSLGKCAVQLVLRAAMLPFVLAVGNDVMSAIVLLDFAGRALELAAALTALRRQEWTWDDISRRMSVRGLSEGARDTARAAHDRAGQEAGRAAWCSPTKGRTLRLLHGKDSP